MYCNYSTKRQERRELKMCVCVCVCVCVCLHLSCIAYTGELSRLAVHTVRLSTFYHFGATIACCAPPRTRWSLPTPINVHQAPPRPFLSHGLLDSRVACIAWTAASISASFSLASIFPSPSGASNSTCPRCRATSLEDDPAPAPRTTVDTPAAISTDDPFCEKSSSPPFARRVAGVWSAVAVVWAGVEATAEELRHRLLVNVQHAWIRVHRLAHTISPAPALGPRGPGHRGHKN